MRDTQGASISSLALLLVINVNKYKNIFKFKSETSIWIAFIIIALLSTFWSADIERSLSSIKKELIYPFLTFLIIPILYINKRTRAAIIISLFTGYILALLLAINFKLSFYPPLTQYYQLVGDTSTLITISLTILLYSLFFIPQHVLLKACNIILIVLSLYTAYLIQNRMAMIIIAIIISMTITLKTYKKSKILSCLLIMLMLLGSALSINIRNDNNFSINNSITAIKNDPRVELIWPFYIKSTFTSPLKGLGFGYEVPSIALKEKMPKSFEPAYKMHAHNVILNKTLQIGFIGIFFFLLLYLIPCKRFYQATKNTETIHAGIIGISITTAFFLKSMTDDFFIRNNIIIFWILIGLLIANITQNKETSIQDKHCT
ncbi:O-antigen ligase family protein [Aliamphritea ceti]|uniref:O-antigen ligase family protein n=1 Tax=Aliamphritea ceti TaxID=1524258 RepID=UPI0021C36919|nr:O-antigen ligase family protein [Aliamphritea ceti]